MVRALTLGQVRKPRYPGAENYYDDMSDELVELCLKVPPHLQRRALNCLSNFEIHTIDDLLKPEFWNGSLKNWPNIGTRTVTALKNVMSANHYEKHVVEIEIRQLNEQIAELEARKTRLEDRIVELRHR